MRSASVREWLAAEGLSQYVELFEQNRIGLDVLADLRELDLQQLGIPLGDRKRLLKAIRSLGHLEPVKEAEAPPRTTRASQAERRQLTVLFCDLVGSTSLSERLDPEELRQLMEAYQRTCGDVIIRYEGHVAQYLGDGLVVYFGWPRAHEDDPIRAIKAGLELVDAVGRLTATAPLSARVGIHTGLVVVGETGDGDASVPKAAVGDTPNIAARLQTLADPGSVVVSERTQDLARGWFDYADLGPQTLRGVSKPIQLFRVAATRSIDNRFDAAQSETGFTPLVWRQEEVALLLRRWQQAKEGEGQVVLVSGEPGIGKSRVARVLREQLSQENHTVIRYQCSPYHVNSALYPIMDQLERAAGFTREDSAEQKLNKLEALLRGVQEQELMLFAALLSLPTGRYATLHVSPQKQKEMTLEALARGIESLAREKPVLLIFEDVHWSDATSQELLDLLVPRLRDLPLLMIVTYRPEYMPRWADQAHVIPLGLNRLGRRQAAELILKLTRGKVLPASLLDQIVSHTDGVPLFIEELTKSVLESNLVQETSEGYLLNEPLPSLAIPTTLRDSLVARLDRLAPIREIAQIGACIGRDFSYELLAAVSPISDEPLDRALDELVQTGLVFRRGTHPTVVYSFKHALVQDAAYDSLLKSKRSQLHMQIARVLEEAFPATAQNEPEVLARHHTAAGLNKEAVAYWLAAAQKAVERFANVEAVHHVTKGLELLQTLPAGIERDRQELLLQVTLGTALGSKGYTPPQVGKTFARARELCHSVGEMGQLFPVLFGLWIYYIMRGQFEASGELAQQMFELGHRTGDRAGILLGDYTTGGTALFLGHLEEAAERTEAGLASYAHNSDSSLALRFGYGIGAGCADFSAIALWMSGYPDKASERARLSLDWARELRHPVTLAGTFAHIAILEAVKGNAEQTLLHSRETIALAQETGNSIRVVEGEITQGWAIAQLGESEKGIEMIQAARQKWHDIGAYIIDPLSLGLLGQAFFTAGRLQDARSAVTAALDSVEKHGERLWEGYLQWQAGVLALAQPGSDYEAAEEHFKNAINIAWRQKATMIALRAATNYARLMKENGRDEEAIALLRPIYDAFTEGFETRELRDAKALLDEMT